VQVLWQNGSLISAQYAVLFEALLTGAALRAVSDLRVGEGSTGFRGRIVAASACVWSLQPSLQHDERFSDVRRATSGEKNTGHNSDTDGPVPSRCR